MAMFPECEWTLLSLPGRYFGAGNIDGRLRYIARSGTQSDSYSMAGIFSRKSIRIPGELDQ